MSNSAPATRTSSRRTCARSTAAFASCSCRPGPPNPEIRDGRSSERASAFGYLDAPLGGIILDAGNSVTKNLSTSRQGFLPRYDADACSHCGICDIVCPDLCFVWSEDPEHEPAVRLLGIDYHYCKGCLKCVDSCPTGSLTQLREEPGWAEENRVPLFPWLEQRGAQ